MICTAYMNVREWGGQITPLFQIEITIDGENEDLIDKIKDTLLSSQTEKKAIQELEETFSIEPNVDGDLIFSKEGEQEITVRIKKTNLLDGLTIENLLDKLALTNLTLDADTKVVIMLKEDYKELYPGKNNTATYDRKRKAIVISVDSVNDIENLKKYIKDTSMSGNEKLNNYLEVAKHELAHHNIETKEEFKHYRDIQANAEQYVTSQQHISVQIKDTPYAALKLHLEGTTDYSKFYTELFAWQEADKNFKEKLLKNKDYQAVLTTPVALDVENKPRTEEQSEQPLFNEVELNKAITDITPQGIQNLGVGELKAYREYLDIAYGPYIPLDNRKNNYTAQIHGFQPGELVYIQWTIKGDKKRPSVNFIKSVERSGNDIVLTVSGRQYDEKHTYDSTGKTDTRQWKDKTVTIKSDGTIESEKQRGKESDFVAKVVAFRKFTGKPLAFNENGVDRTITSTEKELINSNTSNWFFALDNAKKISSYMEKNKVGQDKAELQLMQNGELKKLDGKHPKFLNKTFGQKHDDKDDIGFYFKIDDSSTQTEVGNNVESFGDRLLTKAQNHEALNDTSYNLIKVGDIVTYKIWSKDSSRTSYKDVVVLKTFKEGLLVQDIAEGVPSGESYIVRRKDLFAVYSFFNKGSKTDESTVVNILKEFKEISNELYANRPTANEKAKRTIFTLKELQDPKSYHYESYNFRKFTKDKDDKYALSQEQSFFYPSQETVKFIYGDSNFPSEEFQSFEKELSKVSPKVYNKLKEKAEKNRRGNAYSRDLEDLDNGVNRVDSFGNEIKIGPVIVDLLSRGEPQKILQFLELQKVKKLRREKLELLKAGSYILLNKRVRQDEAGGFEVIEGKRQPIYGVVLAKSNDFLTVAVPNTQWDKTLGRYGDFEEFKILQINVMDFRQDKEYDITKIFNNMNFERSLINTLGTLKQIINKTYAEKATVDKETAEQKVKTMLEQLSAEVNLKRDEDEVGKGPNRISDFFTMVSFYTNFDYIIAEEKEQLRLKDHDIESRNQDRQYYVSMLETGSIVQYKRKAYQPTGQPLRHGSIKNFMVIGKHIQSGMPILADITFRTVNGFSFSYIDPFIPDINSIVGVGFLKEQIEATHLEVDGSKSIISLNPNNKFMTDQVFLLKEYIKSQQVTTYPDIEKAEKQKQDVLETQEKYKWASKPDLYITKTAEIEITRKTRKGEFSYRKRVRIDMNNNTIAEAKYKNHKIIEGTEKLGMFQKWDDGSYKPYSDRSYHLSFNFKDKNNKWVQPKGLRVIDKIVRGTVVNYTYEKGGKSYFGSGIALYKEATYLMLLKYKQDSQDPKDFDDIDPESIDMDDISMFPLYYGSVNVGNETNKDYVLVLPNIRSLTFTQKINRTQFDKLKVTSDASKHGKTHPNIFTKNVGKSTVVQTENKYTITFSKNNISREEKLQSIAELEKYQKKFEDLYGIKFKLLSQKEIQETFDNKPEFNNGIISNYRAFKVNDDYIVINTDLASLQAPFHEMQHFVIEALYKTNTALYNELIAATKEHPLQKKIALDYPELSGRELDEEIFTSILGMVYSDYIKDKQTYNWEKKHESLLGRFMDWLRELLRRLTRKNIDINISNQEMIWNKQKDVLIAFGEDMETGKFTEQVKENKTLNTKSINTIQKLKQDLINKDMLTMYCI